MLKVTPFNIACPGEDEVIEGIIDIVELQLRQDITSQRSTRIASINKTFCQSQDGTTKPVSQTQQGSSSNPSFVPISTSVSSCPGGYAGFDYWYFQQQDGTQEGVAAIQFYCSIDGTLIPEPIVGDSGGPINSPPVKATVRCPAGQSLSSFGGKWTQNTVDNPMFPFGFWTSLTTDGTATGNVIYTCVDTPEGGGNGGGGNGNGNGGGGTNNGTMTSSSGNGSKKTSSSTVGIYVGIGAAILVILILLVIAFANR